ncbi:hypothetical protein [Frigoribacterium sp. VKM Ac-2836]|uniref:HAAS signaling domain-containing protein n=1 Tax=Frigoribacterium sp. VKM Ac-2836 TaxID=2739014 RepID=UPI0015677536|nr:hypothetical protein [Frigoribacterium sp. VKM Ac-2836]NRD27964.1 hypothetical protein [Frigoribacterium sp. VKM Ac-2836]
MTASDQQHPVAAQYLKDLDRALIGAPDDVRRSMLADVADELRGLEGDAARSRIAELGDVDTIAADARADTTALIPAAPNRGYAIGTSITLVAGWYLIPVFGWIAGLIMIGAGTHWTAAERRRGILASVLVILFSAVALVAFRGTAVWGIGLAVFAVGPLVGNIFVASWLRDRWGRTTVPVRATV